MLTVERIKNATIIRFNKPQMRNPLSFEVLASLNRIVDGVEGNQVLIFTGSNGVFSSGANLKEVAKLTPETAFNFACLGQSLMQKISSRNSIAAINGICFGGAFDLVLNCKKRIACPSAKFSHPGISIGIMTGWSGTQILPRLVGRKKALEILLTAKQISAKEALKIGLLDEIVDSPLDFVLKNLI